MARPTDKEYRATILSTFDNYTVASIKNVNEHLKEKGQFRDYQSTRRMLIKLKREGLISEVPKRGEKNSLLYIKSDIFPNTMVMRSIQGDALTLKEFIKHLIELNCPPIMDADVYEFMKSAMLNSIGAADPDQYTAVNKFPPVDKDLKLRLENLRGAVEQLHMFIKLFLDSGVYVSHERIRRELKGTPYLATIVNDFYHDSRNERSA